MTDDRQPLHVDNLTVGYRRRRGQPPRVVLREVTAQVRSGELVCLVGPNGIGKSTLLRSIAGLQPHLAGEVLLAGRSTCRWSRREVASRLAVVLTDRFDPGRLRVADLVALGRHPRSTWTGRLSDTDRAVIHRCLVDVGMPDLLDAEIGELSDGQRQRVLVARALAQEPEVLLLDEPTAFLDPPGRISLVTMLHRVCAERGTAALVCTHDIETAGRHADRLWVAQPSGGLVSGSPQELASSGALGDAFRHDGVRFDAQGFRFVATGTAARRTRAPGCATLPVALLHLAPDRARQRRNREELLASAEDAASRGARLIVAPELATSGYTVGDRDGALAVSETVPGPTAHALADLSRRRRVYCAAGVLERDAGTGLLYNTAIVTGPDGDLVARHRKVVLAERRWAAPGGPVQDDVFDTPWGRIGVLVCADSYYGLPARAQALRGADLLLVLANWPSAGLDPRSLWYARAVENGVPLVVGNRTGREGDFDCRDARCFAVDATGGVLLDEASAEPTAHLVGLPLDGGRIRQRRHDALAGRTPASWHGLGLDTAALRDSAYLWGEPPQSPVTLRLAVPAGPERVRVAPRDGARGPGIDITSGEFDLDGTGPGRVPGALVGTGPAGPQVVTAEGVEALGDRPVMTRVVDGCRIAVTTPGHLRHPETAVALAKEGCDVVIVPAARIDEDLLPVLAARCVERIPVVVATTRDATLYLPPEDCGPWTEYRQEGPGIRRVSLDVAAGRRRSLFDRLDLETLCRACGT
jgi:iron complex transport system ATP-binding protein